MAKKPKILCVVISAAIGVVAFLPLNLYFLSFIFLVPLFYFLHKESRFWKLLLGTIIFRLFFALGTVYYTLEPIVWATSIAIFSILAVVIFISNKLLAEYPYAKIIYVPLAFLVGDMLEAKYSLLPTYIMTAGNVLGSSPFAGLAKYGGLVSLEFFIILTNVLFFGILLNYKRLLENKKKAYLTLAGLAVIFFGGFGLSNYFLNQNSEILISQKNHLKVTTVSIRNGFSQTDLQQLVADLSDIQTDLLVLPEGLFIKPENSSFISAEAAAALSNFNINAEYVVGTFHVLRQGKNYNTAVLVNKKGEIVDQYDKNKLTILGEYWPFAWHPSLYDFLKNDPVTKNYAIVDHSNAYASGTAKIMQIKKDNSSVPFGTLICLEGHYYNMLDSYREKGAKFIISPISNRWVTFGSDHFAYLSGNLYNIESIQSGLPIIVSGVNNFTGEFFPDGTRQIVKYTNAEKYSITTQDVAY